MPQTLFKLKRYRISFITQNINRGIKNNNKTQAKYIAGKISLNQKTKKRNQPRELKTTYHQQNIYQKNVGLKVNLN